MKLIYEKPEIKTEDLALEDVLTSSVVEPAEIEHDNFHLYYGDLF